MTPSPSSWPAGHPNRRHFLALAGAATLGVRSAGAVAFPRLAPVDPTADSAVRLADAIRRREISSVELLEALLARIDAVNPAINAVVQLDRDRAREAAKAA